MLKNKKVLWPLVVVVIITLIFVLSESGCPFGFDPLMPTPIFNETPSQAVWCEVNMIFMSVKWYFISLFTNS